MGSILNGLSVSKIRPYGSGFLIFSDYGRNPLRLGAIMEIPVVFIFPNDSLALGEGGAKPQPLYPLASLRATPGLIVLRPMETNPGREPKQRGSPDRGRKHRWRTNTRA